MKKLLIAALALGFAANASAIDNEPEDGLTVQVNAGMTISTVTGFDIGDSKVGGTAGIKFEYMLPGAFGTYANAGLDWTMKGASKSDKETLGSYGTFSVSNTSTLHYLQIPIHVGYRYNLADNLGIYGEMGPYFSMGVHGRNNITVDADGSWVESFEGSYNLFSSQKNDDPYFQIWDFGFGFRVGAEYDNHYSLSLGMDWGITDMFRDKYRDTMADKGYPLEKAHNYNTYITLGYRF